MAVNDLAFAVKDNYTVSVLYENTTASPVPEVNVVVHTTSPFGWDEVFLILLAAAGILLIGLLFLTLYHRWLILQREREEGKARRGAHSKGHHRAHQAHKKR